MKEEKINGCSVQYYCSGSKDSCRFFNSDLSRSNRCISADPIGGCNCPEAKKEALTTEQHGVAAELMEKHIKMAKVLWFEEPKND